MFLLAATVEKYFRSVARQSRADQSLFRTEGEPGKADTLVEMVSMVMNRTFNELEQLVRAGHDISTGEEALVSFTEVRADDESAEKIRRRLTEVLKEIEALCCEEAPRQGLRRYRLNLAYIPLDLSERSERESDSCAFPLAAAHDGRRIERIPRKGPHR